MPSEDWIPRPDEEFNTFFVDQFAPPIIAAPTTYGLVAADGTALSAAKSAWSYSWVAYQNAKAALAAATADKDAKRASAEGLMRADAAKAQATPSVTNAQKQTIGITVRKTTRTPVAVPSTVPVLPRIDTSVRTRLELHFADSATPNSEAKPAGVHGCEVREQIGGTLPTNPESMVYLTTDTRAPYVATFAPADVGKTVYFALRWVNTRNEPGPWSQVFTATVPG